MLIHCAHCGKQADLLAGHVNRSRKRGAPVFCSKACFGLSRRKHKTKAQLVAEKRDYDMRYREINRERLTAEKAAYYQRTRDPERERVRRKERMHLHVEYCRRPEYRAKKAEYDFKRRCRKNFGEFAEVAMLLRDLDAEIGTRMSRYEIMLANGTLNKALRRRRESENPLSL